MQKIFAPFTAALRSLTRSEPGRSLGGANGTDWLPPVVGVSAGSLDWPQGLMAGMADGGATWYFDRR